MAYLHPYSFLWAQQAQLFSEIDALRYQQADTERQLARAQYILDSPDAKRHPRRKAKWIVSCLTRCSKDFDQDMQLLLHSLLICQTHIARLHMQALNATNTCNTFTQPYHSTRSQSEYTQRSITPDSGFEEPALYAQPFDLNLTQDQPTHIFSHELQHTLPLAINTPVTSPATDPIILSPQAVDFTPSTPDVGKIPTSIAISPPTTPFSPTSFAKANPSSPRHALNTTLLFQQPDWSSSPSDSSEQVGVAMTPLSPTAKVYEGVVQSRRYSIAAVSLIEGRLRHKKTVSDVGIRS
jgi:hypothetical protein